jgi:hypothetical protein
MSGDVILSGTVVERELDSPFSAPQSEGLYLATDNGQTLALVTDSMATQMPVDMLHQGSRPIFEPYLGKKITVAGYLGGTTLWSAMVKEG